MMKKYIFAFLACLSISFSSLIVEAAAATEEYSYDGMGRVVLEKNIVNNVNTLTQDMFYKTGSRVPNTNTIFIIQYDFVLAEDITIPDGCVLKFDGGSISGTHTLTFAKTVIDGNPKIFCALSGNLEKAYITWFGAEDGNKTIDSGAIINKVAAVTNHIIIPSGTFYIIKSPANVWGRKIIDWYGNLSYIGTATNVETFTIGGQVVLNMYGSLSCGSASMSYAGEFGSNIKGLVVKNLNNRKVSVGDIVGFNINLMVIGEGGGCSYNTFYLNSLQDANIGILVTQRDSNGKRGWANENTFIGGRIWRGSSWHNSNPNAEAHAVVVKKVFDDDSYNHCNSLVFLRQSVEGRASFIPFVINNCAYSSFIGFRSEGVDNAMKICGSSHSIDIKAEYGTNAVVCENVTQSMQYPLFKNVGNLSTVTLDVKNPLLGTQGQNSYTPHTMWGYRDVYGGTSSGSLTFNSADQIANNIGFKITFAREGYNHVSISVIGKNRRGWKINPVKKFDGTDIPRNATRENSIIRCRSLNWNPVYYYFSDGADVESSDIVFTPSTKEVFFSFSNATAVTVRFHTEGYISYQ